MGATFSPSNTFYFQAPLTSKPHAFTQQVISSLTPGLLSLIRVGNKGEKKKSCLRLLLLPLQLLQHGLELLLLLLGLLDGRLVLLIVRHGHHGQDQVDQVEGAQEDDQHEEDHVGLPCRAQSLTRERRRLLLGLDYKMTLFMTA